MKSSYAYHQGQGHAETNEPCQDYAATYCDEHLSAIAIADGCSGSKYAFEAARINVDVTLAFVADVENWRQSSKEALLNDLLGRIRQALRDTGHPLEAMSATLCVAALKSDGEYLLISIGDGTITALDSSLEPFLLVEPYNGATKTRTVFTNSKDAVEHAEVRNYTIRKYDFAGFAIYTDGCEKLFTRWLHKGGRYLRQAAAHTLLDGDAAYLEELMALTAGEYTNDDVSLAIVLEETPETLAAAEEILAAPPETETVQETPGSDLSDYPVMYHAILRALLDKPMTPEELTDGGYIPAGKVLEIMKPLIRQGIVSWSNGAFCFSAG